MREVPGSIPGELAVIFFRKHKQEKKEMVQKASSPVLLTASKCGLFYSVPSWPLFKAITEQQISEQRRNQCNAVNSSRPGADSVFN